MKLRWSQINWTEAEEQVSRLQIRIVKATLEQKWRLVKRLQYLMTNSFYAKAIAVKRVITNKGKRTPGIDGELWKTDVEKMKAVNELNCQTYHAKPLKRIYIKATAWNSNNERPSDASTSTVGVRASSGNNCGQDIVWISQIQKPRRCKRVCISNTQQKRFTTVDTRRRYKKLL